MFDDAKFYRERETAERLVADTTGLTNIRMQSLRAADRWNLLAEKAERTQFLAALRPVQVRNR